MAKDGTKDKVKLATLKPEDAGLGFQVGFSGGDHAEEKLRH
jgi:hypothetical protein